MLSTLADLSPVEAVVAEYDPFRFSVAFRSTLTVG